MIRDPLTRRSFVRTTLALGATALLPLSSGVLRAASAPQLRQGRGLRKRVAVLGGGVAGLAAAFELDAAGHDVTVLEARTRPGGRVLTIREPFADGLYAEAGATRIASTNDWTLKYVRQFGLELVPFRPADLTDVLYLRGRRIIPDAGVEPDWPVPLIPEERALGVAGLQRRYVVDALSELGDAGIPDVPPTSLRRYDRVSYLEFLRERGASPGATELLTLGAGEDAASALQRLRALTWRRGAQWWKIAGGNDRLPHAFATRLAARIRYGAAVVRVRHDAAGVVVHYRQAGETRELRADHAVCTIPFSVLGAMDVAPLSAPKRRAIAELHYSAVTKVILQTRTRFWRDAGLSGFADTDLPVPEVWDLSEGQPGQRGLLMGYVTEPHAAEVAGLPKDARLSWTLAHMERIFPGLRAEYEGGASHAWQDDPWSRGAYPIYGPGQVIDLFPAVRQPEGRLHFAGDHASVWPGWIQGALESANRVALAIDAAQD